MTPGSPESDKQREGPEDAGQGSPESGQQREGFPRVGAAACGAQVTQRRGNSVRVQRTWAQVARSKIQRAWDPASPESGQQREGPEDAGPVQKSRGRKEDVGPGSPESGQQREGREDRGSRAKMLAQVPQSGRKT